MEKIRNSMWVFEEFRQRVTTKTWHEMLLNDEDHIIFRGNVRKLKADKVGPGVYEIYKEALK